MASRRIVNAVSLSRVPIALTFVLVFQKNERLFEFSVALAGLALVTDVLDGFVARRLAVESIHGRHWDSLGDKAFYAAVITAFNAQGLLSPVLTWGLIVREIALYITRIQYVEKLPKVEQIRKFTNWHGYFMYALIVFGFANMYVNIRSLSINLYPYTQVAGLMALLCGVASIIHWLRLD